MQRLLAPVVFLTMFAMQGCASGAALTPNEPTTRIVTVRPQMSEAQSREAAGCDAPLATNAAQLAEEDAECRDHAERLADWVAALQALIRGEVRPPAS